MEEIEKVYAENNVGINVGINLLNILKSNPKRSAREMAPELGISQRQVERLLSELKRQRKIERMGARKNGYWKVND